MTGSLLAAFLAQVGIITYRFYAVTPLAPEAPLPMPLPAWYFDAMAVYGVLALVPEKGARTAGLIGWGFVAATFLGLFGPGGKPTQQPGIGASVANPLQPGQLGPAQAAVSPSTPPNPTFPAIVPGVQ